MFTPLFQNNLPKARLAFTLIELVVSIALVMVLLLGVTQVFKMGGQAVGANQALSGITREGRAATATMVDDFRNVAPDSPMFIINSGIAYKTHIETVNGIYVQRGTRAAFKSAVDAQNFLALNPNNPNIDPVMRPSPTVAGQLDQVVALGSGSDYVPRLDRVSFFTRGSLNRGQMFAGTPPPSTVASNEAYVWYGHLAYPRGGWSYGNANTTLWLQMLLPENQYSSERLLGRMVVCMKHRESTTLGASVPIDRGSNPPAGSTLSYRGGNGIIYGDTSPAPFVWTKDYSWDDVSGKSIDDYRDCVGYLWKLNGHFDPTELASLTPEERTDLLALEPTAFISNWYTFLDDHLTDYISGGRPDPTSYPVSSTADKNSYPYLDNDLTTSQPSLPTSAPNDPSKPIFPPNGHKILRHMADTSVARPFNATSVNKTAPIFAGRCTQFIVEYAGDYLNQDPVDGSVRDVLYRAVTLKKRIVPLLAGAATREYQVTVVKKKLEGIQGGKNDAKDPSTHEYLYGSDGEIDYILETLRDAQGNVVKDANNQPVKSKRIRWYGLPRDVNGDGVIDINDVVPMADVLAANNIYLTIGTKRYNVMAPWEQARDLPCPTNISTQGNALNPQNWMGLFEPTTIKQNYANFPARYANTYKYVCAWHDDSPQMIRVLMKLEDPTGKVQEGQWYEQVFKLR